MVASTSLPTSRSRSTSRKSRHPHPEPRCFRRDFASVLGTLRQLSERVGGRVAGNGEAEIERISAVDDAGPGPLTFATDQRYLAKALAGGASAVLVDESLAPQACDKPLLIR